MMEAVKKICVLTSSYPRWKKDFAGNFLHNLFKKMVQTSQVTVLVPGYWQSKEAEEIENVNIKRFTYFFPRRWQRLAYGDGMSANLENSFLPWLQIPSFFISFLVNAFVVSKDKEIIWSHWILPSGLIGAILKRFTHKKHIATLHSSDVHFLNRIILKKYLISFIVRHTDVFTAVCYHTRNFFLDSLPAALRDSVNSKLFVLSLGVDKQKKVSRLEMQNLRRLYGFEEDKIILYLGRLEPVKGLYDLIKAIKGLKGVSLVIAGEGRLKNNLVQYANNLLVKVKFTGEVDEERRFELLAMCDLVVVPSASLKNGRGEGLPVVILEAFAFGKPVIASLIGGIKEVVKDDYNGFTVPERSPLILRSRIEHLFKDEALYQRLSKGAAETGENYNLENIKDYYVHFLQRV